MIPIIFHPEAEEELNNAIAYYNKRIPNLGIDFLEEIQKTTYNIQKSPQRAQIVKYNIRKTVIHRFPYNIYYGLESDEIKVIAIAHHKRKPYYWKTRI